MSGIESGWMVGGLLETRLSLFLLFFQEFSSIYKQNTNYLMNQSSGREIDRREGN